MSYDSEIETTPLVYDSNKDGSTVKQVLFIDQSVGEFSQYVNNDTFAIQYSFTSSSTELMEVLRSRFSQIERIGFVFHYSAQASFMDLEYLFVPSDFTGGSISKGLELVLEILLDFDVQHVDFLACKTLLDTNWRQYFDLLEGNSNAVVSASDDNTGNLKYGGDWLLENTMTNVKTIYFNDLVGDYALLLSNSSVFPYDTFNKNQYYNVFYTVSKSNPSVLNAKFYDQSQTLISTQDISFNGKTMKEMLAFLENSAANPYAIGKTRTGFRSMDLTYGAVYKKALKDSQQQSLMTYVNKTFKNVYSSAVTVYDVKVNGFMKYLIDDVEQPNLVATQIGTYVFDQSDPSNHGHRLKFRNLTDSTTPYTTNVTHEGTPGTPNSYSIIDVTQTTPDLQYYCEIHTGSMYGEFKTLTDLTSYRVKVIDNILGDPVFSLSPPGTNEYYNQIDVSFGAGSKILFDVSHYTMADVSFVFGTVVDNSSTIIDSFVTYQDGLVMLDICSGYVGESLKYFEDTTAGMGYVEASLPFTGPAEPELIWLKMDTGDLTGSTLTNHGSDTSIGNATTVNNPSISTIHKKIGTGSIFVDHSNIYSRESINLPIVSLPTNFTVSFWMKLGSNIYPTNSIWWYKNTNDWTSNGLFMKIEASNIGSDSKKLALYVKSSRTLVSSPYSNNQNWNHICLTCGHNGTNYTIKMYLNNSLLSNTNSTLNSAVSYNYHTLGAGLIGGGYFDDYRFYNRVLSSSEISSVYNYVQGPTIHSKVVTVSGDTVVFYIDDFANPNFTFTSGDTYIFDQSHHTNVDNTLVLGTVTDSSVNLINYQTIVGTPGQPGAYTSFTASSGTVFYFSYQTDNMGGQISI